MLIKGKKWDAVIDESASLSSAPEWVKLSADLLEDATETKGRSQEQLVERSGAR